MSKVDGTLWVSIPNFTLQQNSATVIISQDQNTVISLPQVTTQNSNLYIVNQSFITGTTINDSNNNLVIQLDVNQSCILNPLIGFLGNTPKWVVIGYFSNKIIPDGGGILSWNVAGNLNTTNAVLGTLDNNNFSIVQDNSIIATVSPLGISMNNLKISNLLDPVNPKDAATKEYVDSHIPTTGGWVTTGNGGITSGVLGTTDNNNFSIIRNNSTNMSLLSNEINIPNNVILSFGNRGTNSSQLVIKQAGQISNSQPTSIFGIKFINSTTDDNYYIGYSVGGSFGIFQFITPTTYLRCFDISSSSINSFAPLSLNNFNIKNVANPVNLQDATTKSYVDLLGIGYNYTLLLFNGPNWIRIFTISGSEGSVISIYVTEKNTDGNGAESAHVELNRKYNNTYSYILYSGSSSGMNIAVNYSEIWCKPTRTNGELIVNCVVNSNGNTSILPGGSTVLTLDGVTNQPTNPSGVIDMSRGSQLDINNHNIINVVDPIQPQDAATKSYVDTHISLITPILQNHLIDSNISCTGIICSASSEASLNTAYQTFIINNAATNWSSTTGAGSWLQIQFPSSFIIKRVSLMAFTTGTSPLSSNLQGSNDGVSFATLISYSSSISAFNPTVSNLSISTAYSYYRFNFLAMNVGQNASFRYIGIWA